LQFALWDSASGGSQAGSTLTLNSVAVSNGVFVVTLDFGANSFPGANRFLEISARTIGAASFTLLTPRQQVTSTPYAVRSASSANADTATTASNAATATNATQLGGIASGQYVQTNDSRLADARSPVAGSPSYVQNTSSQQTGTNFNISGNGTVGGTLTGNVVNSSTQFNIGGLPVFGISGPNTVMNTFAGVSAGAALSPSTAIGSANGKGNSFFGNGAGQSTTTGFSNSFFGINSGAQNVTSGANAFFGFNAGFDHTSGTFNAFFGTDAGQSNITGSNNTALGGFTDVGDNLTNASAIGANAQVAQSNSLVLGSIKNVNNATADTKVGIGVTTPAFKLHVIDSGHTGLRVEADTAGGTVASFGGFGEFQIDAVNVVGGRFLVRENGNVGIGTAVPSAKLEVEGDAWVVGKLNLFSLGSGGSTPLCVNSSPAQVATCSSSLRYKTNIASFAGGLDIINRLRPISFTWKQDGKKDIGLGAEEVAQVAPLLTFKNDKGEIEGVKYNQLSAVFINAFKQQQAQIEALRQANAVLNVRLRNLEQRRRKRVASKRMP
jgi:hypothetical protein